MGRLLLVCLLALTITSVRAAGPVRPNVVLILVDDLGWTDFACYGSDLHQTPHVDQLARDGMRFTQAYSACTVCSPTRASILTGKYPARLHITDWIPGLPPENPKLLVPEWTKHLPLEERNLARVFKDAGYVTASIGKWHLGDEPYYPLKQGFDRNVAGTAAAAPPSYFAPWKIATLSEGRDRDYLTDRLGQEAVQFIEEQQARPFFLYLAHFGVHTPIQGPPDLVAKYRKKLKPGLKQTNPAYAAMVESVDATIGRIRAKLAELKLNERTILIVTSDNGGRVPTTSNHPLRVGKGSCYEGGVRVPLIIHWPGVTRPGSTVDTPVMSIDLYPTVVQMVNLPETPTHRPDGVSLVALLKQSGGLQRDELFWHYPHYQHYQQGGTTPYSAIRKGDEKLIEFFADGRVELYNLRTDIGEQHDLAATQPQRVADLRSRLRDWRKEVGAQMPTRNPNHNPDRPEHTPKKK